MKIYTRDEVLSRLVSDDKWLFRGVLAIYRHQVEDEQRQERTKYRNGVGFNAADAPVLTPYATHLLERKPIHPSRMGELRNRMQKYAGQLARIANGEA